MQKTMHRGALCSVLLTKCHSDEQIKKNEMGEACSTYWNREVHKGFWLINLRGKYHLEDLDLDRSIILKWISKRWDVAAWIGLLPLRIMTGRTVPVIGVMNTEVPRNAVNLLTEDLLTSQKRICIMELLFILFVCQSVACRPVTRMRVAFIRVGAG